MTKAEQARQAAIDRVGDAYVYGAWDQFCTVQNRNKYAKLSENYADKIKQYCPRMSGKSDYCDGCKYLGHRIHDCRGLTSACAKAAGIETITGQTVAKQWNADTWAEKGPIDTLPELPYVQLFRHDGQKWAHTGIYIGNGETVDARSHAKGVIRCKLSDYKWTHWAIPKGMYEELPEGNTGGDGVEVDTMYEATVCTKSSDLNMRSGPGKAYKAFQTIPRGATVEVLIEYDNGWDFIRWNGMTGYVSAEYLKPGTPTITVEPPDGGGVQTPTDEEEAQPAQDSAQGWGVWILCENAEEAKRYAGNVKGAIVVRFGADPP